MLLTTGTLGEAWSARSRLQSPILPIPNRSSTAKFVDGAVIAMTGGGLTIICPSSQASANPKSESWSDTTSEARLRSQPCLCRSSGDPIGEPPKATRRSVSRPGFKSRGGRWGRSCTKPCLRSRDLVYLAFLNPRQATSFSTSKVTRSSETAGWNFCSGIFTSMLTAPPQYTGDWASNRQDERAAFERFIDFVSGRLAIYPDLHIYHFAPYEPAALKRLMGRYATRENEVDNLLRAEIFVDLFSVVRHSIRASVESYSIKKLEPLYSFERTVPLEDVGRVMARTQARLEMADSSGIPEEDKTAIKGYNRDDCASTSALQMWLEAVRGSLIANGAIIERPVPKVVEISEKLGDWQKKVERPYRSAHERHTRRRRRSDG